MIQDYGSDLPNGLILPPIIGSGNDYSFIEQKVGSIEPRIPISIILPVYNRIDMLRRTMAMLTHQTYPLKLMEIIIADDGSSDHPEQLIQEFETFFPVNYVRQKDEGYRLSHVRNLGVRAAKHDNIIILDCDMAPVPNLVETFAKWLVFDEKVLLIGHRRYVDANDIPPKEVLKNPSCMLELPPVATQNAVMKQSPSKDWRESIYNETNMLKNSPHPFRASSCGNVGFHRRIFSDAGNFDEEFTAWGAEDNEFGYRVWNAGYYFIPLLDALGLHQEPPGGREFVDREAGKLITRPMLLDKVPTYRDYDPDIESTTPSVSIYIPAFNARKTISRAIDSALSQTYRDFDIIICNDGSTDGTGDFLDNYYSHNSRITIIHQENKGIGAASNACINLATGMYVLQLDSDDELHNNTIEELIKEIDANPKISCVYGRHCKRNENNYGAIEESWFYPKFSRIRMLYGMIVHHPRLFRKRDWSRVNGFSEELENAVDFDFFQKLSEKGRIINIESVLYTYSIHAISTSINRMEIQTRNTFKVMKSALIRMGLNNWIVEKDPTYSGPRAVKFSKKLTPEEISKREKEPFISVVIITKDRANLLSDAIRSTLNQSYDKLELLIVDDGSTDNTEEIVNSFSDSRIRYIKKKASGIPKSRNIGVRDALGEFIVIMDDDDLMLPSRIRDHVDALTPESSGSYGGWVDQNSDLQYEYNPGAPHGYSQILFGGKVMLHPASMIKRDVLLEYPYDEHYSYGTDYVMNLEISRAGHRLNHTGTYILLRRFHGANVTITNSGEQQNTARVRWQEFIDGLDNKTEARMRQEWRETGYYTGTPKPSLALLETSFPWMKIIDTEVEDIELEQSPDDLILKYDVNQRWKQNGRVLEFDALTRTIFFEMPFGWKLVQTHEDLFRLAHHVLMSPWEKGILDNWTPSRKKGWRPGLAFSGGVDSTACMLLMPSETVLCYHERTGFDSQLNHSNAHRFIEQLTKDGRHVVTISSDHETIRMDHEKGPGFSTDLAGAVHVILLADYFELDAIAMGMPLENAYLFHGHTGRDFSKSNFWKTNHENVRKAGLDLLFPTAGVSEVINQKIVESSKYENFAESCLRSKKKGEVCGICWKCFRKNSMKGKGVRLEGETAVFLDKRPLKQAISSLYAIQRLPENQLTQIKEEHLDLIELLENDYSLIERHLPLAFDLLPNDYASTIRPRIENISKPMTKKEISTLLKMQLK